MGMFPDSQPERRNPAASGFGRAPVESAKARLDPKPPANTAVHWAHKKMANTLNLLTEIVSAMKINY
jgi:hypothetical protein